jgi:hypothetical protein
MTTDDHPRPDPGRRGRRTPEAQTARAAKRDLRPMLFDIFNGHHDRVQKHERGDLKAVKEVTASRSAHCDIDPRTHMSVMDQVSAALAATPFAAHFAKPEVHRGHSSRSSASTPPTPCTSSAAGIVTGLPRRELNPWLASPRQCWRRTSATS